MLTQIMINEMMILYVRESIEGVSEAQMPS